MAGSHNHNVSMTSHSPSNSPFIENLPNTNTTTPETVLPTIETTVGVNLLFASNPIDALQVILTCPRLVYESGEAADPKQRYAYHLSIILNLFPALEETVIADLKEIGADVVKKVIPVTGIELEPDAGPNECLIVVAQAIYLLYMNIDHERYDNTMRNIINTLKAQLGMDLRTEILPAFSYEHALLFMTVSESYLRLKEDVIIQVINNRVGHGQLSKMCDYICGVLACKGIRSLMCIGELLATNSPVLRDINFLVEVRNLARAVSFLNNPQYDGNRKTCSKAIPIEPAGFSTLYLVDERLRKEIHENTITCDMSMYVSDASVTEVVNTHKAAIAGRRPH